MSIARVFPRRTAASPNDDLAFFGLPPLLSLPEIDEVHISVAFTWDMKDAEYLEKQWRAVGVPVKMGGPAFNLPGGEFVPGRYLKHGYTITSRGCPNHCWFCSVPKREGGLHELPVKDGWNILDDNLLACSEAHVVNVFEMLKRQPHRPIFTGGLEAKLLKAFHTKLLAESNPERMYFAYDTPDDYEPLLSAMSLLEDAGFKRSSHIASCYVLIGYPGDTFEKAERRLIQTCQAGYMPYAMLYRDNEGKYNREWRKFQREWCRPAIAAVHMKEANT